MSTFIQTAEWKTPEDTVNIGFQCTTGLKTQTFDMDLTAEEYNVINRFVSTLSRGNHELDEGPWIRYIFPPSKAY